MGLTQDLLRDVFDYDEGILIRRKNGKRLDGKQKKKYHRTHVNGKDYSTHRLVWIWNRGEIPKGLMLDHINRDKLDNRIENLRLVTRSENQFNRGAKGYHYHSKLGRWVASIQIDKHRIYLGSYVEAWEAEEAYLKAKSAYHIISEK